MFRNGASIYVANTGPAINYANQILVFHPGANGNVTPFRVIEGPATLMPAPGEVTYMVTGADGYLYVAWSILQATDIHISVFAPGANGNVAPVRVIAGANTGFAGGGIVGLDVDDLGRLFVATNGPNLSAGQVLVFAQGASGNVAPVRTFAPEPISGHEEINSLSIWRKTVYLSYFGISTSGFQLDPSIGLVDFDARGETVPTSRIHGPASGLADTEVRFITADARSPRVWAAMLDPVADVWILRCYDGGVSTPVANLGGSLTGFAEPNAAACSEAGRLHITHLQDDAPASVCVFDPQNQNGNVAPDFVISGLNTQLYTPLSITIGPN